MDSGANADRARRIAAKTQALVEAREQKKQQLITDAKAAQFAAADAGATLGLYHREIGSILTPAQGASQAVQAAVTAAQSGQTGDSGLHDAAEAAGKHAGIAEGSEQLGLNKVFSAREQMARITKAHADVHAAAAELVSLTDETAERDAMNKLSSAVDRLHEYAQSESDEIEEAATALTHYSQSTTSGCQLLEKLARVRRVAATADAKEWLQQLSERLTQVQAAVQQLQPLAPSCDQLSTEAAAAWSAAVSAVEMLRRLRGSADGGATAVVGRLAEAVQRASQTVLSVYECSERASELVSCASSTCSDRLCVQERSTRPAPREQAVQLSDLVSSALRQSIGETQSQLDTALAVSAPLVASIGSFREQAAQEQVAKLAHVHRLVAAEAQFYCSAANRAVSTSLPADAETQLDNALSLSKLLPEGSADREQIEQLIAAIRNRMAGAKVLALLMARCDTAAQALRKIQEVEEAAPIIADLAEVLREAEQLADQPLADRARQLQDTARLFVEKKAMAEAMAICAAAKRGEDVESNLQAAAVKAVQLNVENGARVLEEVKQIRAQLLQAKQDQEATDIAAKDRMLLLERCKELSKTAEQALEACTIDRNRAAAALLERLQQMAREAADPEFEEQLEELTDDCDAQWEEFQVAAAIVLQAHARRKMAGRQCEELKQGGKRKVKMEQAMAKVPRLDGEAATRDLLHKVQAMAEETSGEMWDHYQSMMARLHRDIQEIQKGAAAAQALKDLKNKSDGGAEETMRKRLRERLQQGQDAERDAAIVAKLLEQLEAAFVIQELRDLESEKDEQEMVTLRVGARASQEIIEWQMKESEAWLSAAHLWRTPELACQKLGLSAEDSEREAEEISAKVRALKADEAGRQRLVKRRRRQELHRVCDVCYKRSMDASGGTMIECDQCGVQVHAECYSATVPDGYLAGCSDWLCDACRADQIPECVLCPRQHSRRGAMKRITHSNSWVHLACALWVPEVPLQLEAMQPGSLDRIPAHRWHVRCVVCKEVDGLAIKCSHPECSNAFHTMCARHAGFHMLWDQATVLCLSDHQATNQFALHEQVLATCEADEFAYPATITKIFLDGTYHVAWTGGRAAMPQQRLGEASISRFKSRKFSPHVERLTGRAALMASPSKGFSAGSNRQAPQRCVGCKREFPNKKKCDAHMQWCKHVANMTHGAQLGVRLLFTEAHAQTKNKKKNRDRKPKPKEPSLTRSRDDVDRSGDSAVARGAAILERPLSPLSQSSHDDQVLETLEQRKLRRRILCMDVHTGVFVVFTVLVTPLVLGVSGAPTPLLVLWMIGLVLWGGLVVVLLCYRGRVVEAGRIEAGERDECDNSDDETSLFVGTVSPNRQVPNDVQ